jgi:hypothetical protein
MSIGTLWRLTRERLEPAKARRSFQSSEKKVREFSRLYRNGERAFAKHVRADWMRFLSGGVQPVKGQALDRARAAIAWLSRAQDATPDDGVSYGYFPSRFPGGWAPSYPETTGYIIPTMIDYGQRYGAPEAVDRAVRMARWEIAVQMPSGAVQGGSVRPRDQQTPAVFNTGMVLQGFTAAYRVTQDGAFMEAGRRAADFLVGDLDASYFFRTNGDFVAANQKKTYNCLCAWAMYRFGEDSGDVRYKDAAVRVIEAALTEQRPNGWIGNNCLSRPASPLTHTIGYALQGILEVGRLAGRTDFVDGVRRGLAPIIAQIHGDGFLPGRFFNDWQAGALSSCLTGSAQLAIVCYRMHQIDGQDTYRAAGTRLVDFLKGVQIVDPEAANISGALPGSFPILGDYMYLGYPNWATKYAADALMLQHELEA